MYFFSFIKSTNESFMKLINEVKSNFEKEKDDECNKNKS